MGDARIPGWRCSDRGRDGDHQPLRAGADALEDLIAAAARMLAAPDIGDGVPDALAPAIDSLDAFAHGLNAANAARLGGS